MNFGQRRGHDKSSFPGGRGRRGGDYALRADRVKPRGRRRASLSELRISALGSKSDSTRGRLTKRRALSCRDLAFERLLEPLRAARILHHGGGLLVVDKPPGIPVHGGDEALGGDLVTRLGAWLRARGESDYVGVHQRLDEGTSGVLLFTTSREKNSELARASSEHAL